MKPAIMEICTARLCPVCIGEMERDNYFVRPTHGQAIGAIPDILEPGICDRCCRLRSMTKLRRYLLNREGMKERGLIHD